MSKPKQVLTSLMSFLPGKTTHELGECSVSQAVETLLRDLGKEGVLWSVRRGNWQTGQEWLGGLGFPYKAGRVLFSRLR